MSLSALFDGASARAGDPGTTITGIVERICVGGWPAVAGLDPVAAMPAMPAYLTEIARTDIQRVAGVRRDPARVERVLRSLARNTATPVALSRIAADAGGSDGPLERESTSRHWTGS